MRPGGSGLGPTAPPLADAGVTDFVAAEVAREEDRERTRSLLKAVIAGR
jgi:hypothetical protein